MDEDRPWDRRNAIGTRVDDELRAKLRDEIAAAFMCDPEELRGEVIGECFKAAERNWGVDILWGCWSSDDLAQTL